jgi:hypothetical protein
MGLTISQIRQQLAAAADLQMPPSPETAATWPPIRPGPGVDVMGVIGGPVFR